MSILVVPQNYIECKLLNISTGILLFAESRAIQYTQDSSQLGLWVVFKERRSLGGGGGRVQIFQLKVIRREREPPNK